MAMTADALERQKTVKAGGGGYGPNFGNVFYNRFPVNTGSGTAMVDANVAAIYADYSYALQGFPSNFIFELSKVQSTMKSPLTTGQISVIAGKYGLTDRVNQLLRNNTQLRGGGGGGVPKADQIRTISAAVNDMARQLGIPFTPEQIANLAGTAQAQNWSSDQILDELTKNVNWYRLNSGALKTSYEEFKTIGRQFLVNLSDASAQNWSLQIARGEMTADTALQSIKEAAKIANPWLATYIDQGLNPVDVLSANRDFVAQNLEIDPLSLDLMNAKTMNLLTVVDNGQRRLANQTEMTRTIRQDERWKNTNNAKDLTSSMASMLAKIFGRSVY